MQENILCLGDLRFQVEQEKGTLTGFVSNATDFQLHWQIEVVCKDADVTINGASREWRPRVYWNGMALSIRDWRKLAGNRYRPKSTNVWSKMASLLTGNPNARRTMLPGIYLDTHEILGESEIDFVSRKGTHFCVDWKFIWPDVMGYFGEPGENQFPGSVRTIVEFRDVGVWLDAVDNKAKATARLAQDLDVTLFSEPKEIDRSASKLGPSFEFKPID